MPPTLRCPTAIPSVSCTNHLRKAGQQSLRSFSTTPRNDARPTRARRAFFRWLGTQGANFQEPLKGSTNYLGAYDRFGNLKRVVEAKRVEQLERLEQEAAKASGREYTPPEPNRGPKKETIEPWKRVKKLSPSGLRLFTPQGMPKDIEDGKGNKLLMDKHGRLWLEDRNGNTRLQDSSLAMEEDAQITEEAVVLPPERKGDMIPFPENKTFISQPVLSAKYRKKIWQEVMLEGKTVREVSAEHRVEMSRVGAIVRLMEVEEEWKRIVSHQTSLQSVPHITFMMML